MAEESESEVYLSPAVQQREDVPSAGCGEPRRVSWSKALARCVLMLTTLVFYFWVVAVVVTRLVIPASLDPFYTRKAVNTNASNTADEDRITFLIPAICKNGILLALFALQHTIMANCTGSIRECLEGYNMAAYGRAIYVMATCCVLEIVYMFWTPLPYFTLWHVPTPIPLTLVLVLVHVLCWCSIASSLFMLDYLELLGLKQLYYYHHLGNHGDPMSHKSEEQRELYGHMRHPVFLAPLVILWACPVMTYDRVLLGIMVPLYSFVSSRIDSEDVHYVKEQYVIKKRELLSLKRE